MDTSDRPAGPKYFHLLWDEEIERLQEALHLLHAHQTEVLDRWYQLYTVHFGEAASLSRHDFLRLYGGDLDRTVGHLLSGNIERFIMEMQGTGEGLVEQGVPFREVISCLHLFEESCNTLFEQHGLSGHDPSLSTAHIFLTFDKLSHCRMMILAESYFDTAQARHQTREVALEAEAARLAPSPHERRLFHGIVGHSPAMRDIFQRISAASASRGTVLIVGESGTGKELVARAIHEFNAKQKTPFVPVNCSALPRELIESELFGYKRGAFSGATVEYQGLFRAAEGGSLFLDEVTEMAPETQAKLLRVLQERTIRPVGSVREIPVNGRIIGSTNRDPREAVARGQLREDLYYRLHVNTLYLPPLRERPEDIRPLLDYFLTYFSERLGVGRREFEPSALTALERYDWPGNVRELMNIIESAYTFGKGDRLTLDDLSETISKRPPQRAVESPRPSPRSLSFADTERDLIVRALESTNGNKLQAAKLLGISRKRLYAKISKYGLSRQPGDSSRS